MLRAHYIEDLMQSAHGNIVIRLTVTVVALTKIIEEGIEEDAAFFCRFRH